MAHAAFEPLFFAALGGILCFSIRHWKTQRNLVLPVLGAIVFMGVWRGFCSQLSSRYYILLSGVVIFFAVEFCYHVWDLFPRCTGRGKIWISRGMLVFLLVFCLAKNLRFNYNEKNFRLAAQTIKEDAEKYRVTRLAAARPHRERLVFYTGLLAVAIPDDPRKSFLQMLKPYLGPRSDGCVLYVLYPKASTDPLIRADDAGIPPDRWMCIFQGATDNRKRKEWCVYRFIGRGAQTIPPALNPTDFRGKK